MYSLFRNSTDNKVFLWLRLPLARARHRLLWGSFIPKTCFLEDWVQHGTTYRPNTLQINNGSICSINPSTVSHPSPPSSHCHHAPSIAPLDDRMPVAPGVGWPSRHLRSSSSGAPNPRRRCRRCSNRRRSPGPFLGGLDGAGGCGW